MWYYKNKEFKEVDIPENTTGFVYRITNKSNGMMYIGKKIFFNIRKRKPLKGKKRRRIDFVKSDWESYYGSNEVLKEEVSNTENIENYYREILYLCRNKTEMSYIETKLLFENDVLLKDEYYNAWITCRITKRGLNEIQISSE